MTDDLKSAGRRRLLALASVAGGAVLAGATGGAGLAEMTGGERARDLGDRRIPFDGEHQAGILAPYAAHGWFTAFDLQPGVTAARLAGTLRAWTAAARRLTEGRSVAADDMVTAGYGPASVTITVGFGASMLRRIGAPVPGELDPLPPFPRDEIDKSRSDGDLGVLVTADDALVVAHALRTLARLGRGTVRVRWQMSGFSTADGVVTGSNATPRNLMGQLDGTGNPRPSDAGFDEQIFASGPAWMRGGSYLVFRRIRMLLEDWETLPRDRQEAIVGRRKATGAPLSGGTEFTPLDLERQNSRRRAGDRSERARTAGVPALQQRSDHPAQGVLLLRRVPARRRAGRRPAVHGLPGRPTGGVHPDPAAAVRCR
jgi:dye decolorizing peroxidase